MSKRSQTQAMTHCLVSLKSYKRQKYSDGKQVPDCWGPGEGWDCKKTVREPVWGGRSLRVSVVTGGCVMIYMDNYQNS